MSSQSPSFAGRGFHRWLSPWQKVRSKTCELGYPPTVALILRRVLPAALESFYLCQLDLGRADRTYDRDPKIRQGRFPDDVERFMAQGVPDSNLPVAPTPGTMFWVFEDVGRPVAYMWLERRGFRIGVHRYLRLKPPPDAISGVMLWVAPDHRGRGLGPRLNRHARSECVRAGLSRVVSAVDTLNRISLRADAKVGYERVCRVTAVRFLGLTLIRYAGRWHVGRWSSAHPFEIRVEES